MPEQDRFVRGMFAWLGFQSVDRSIIPSYRSAPAGETKYPLFKMVRSVRFERRRLSFSDALLRLAIWCGLAVLGPGALYGGWVMLYVADERPSSDRGLVFDHIVVKVVPGRHEHADDRHRVGFCMSGASMLRVKQRPLLCGEADGLPERDEAAAARPAIRAVHE